MNFITCNGTILSSTQPLFTIKDNFFKYGDSIFEVMRLVNGDLLFDELHSNRLQNGLDTLAISDGSAYTTSFLTTQVQQLAQRNGGVKNAIIKFSVFRDTSGSSTTSSGYLIEMWENPISAYVSNHKGLIIDVYEKLTKPLNFLSNLSNSYLFPGMLAEIYRKQKSLDEMLLLNQNGFLCEALRANIFILFDKRLYTPSLGEGCVSRVMREVVMNLADEMNLPVIEAQINPDILNMAEEVFLVDNIHGIQWVMGFNNKRYFNKASATLLGRLNKYINEQ